jgi:ribonuclease PH
MPLARHRPSVVDNLRMPFLRSGGRAADQLRPVRITRGFTVHAEGSVLIEFGDTRVLCTASVEDRVPPHKRGSGEGHGGVRDASARHAHARRP